MEPNALARLKRVAGKQTTTLTHYGRKTGKPHEVTIWFVLDGDKLFIGTATRWHAKGYCNDHRLQPGKTEAPSNRLCP
jgi:hypothetical protein